MRRVILIGTVFFVVVLGLIGFLVDRHRHTAANSTVNSSDQTPPTSAATPTTTAPPVTENQAPAYQSPLGNTKERVTKKEFGTYVTPQNSPVQPEHFTGYHTAWDFETTAAEANTDVTVTAFCAGRLLVREWASGYGGVAVQSCNLHDQDITVIYGHLNVDSIVPKVGDNLSVGDKIGSLGTGFSQQTDGERKHLHFGIHKGTEVNIKGYVQSESELAGWVDPATYLGKLH